VRVIIFFRSKLSTPVLGSAYTRVGLYASIYGTNIVSRFSALTWFRTWPRSVGCLPTCLVLPGQTCSPWRWPWPTSSSWSTDETYEIRIWKLEYEYELNTNFVSGFSALTWFRTWPRSVGCLPTCWGPPGLTCSPWRRPWPTSLSWSTDCETYEIIIWIEY